MSTATRSRAKAEPSPTEPRRCYGYIRVSTDKQSLSPEAQRDIIQRTAERNGLGDIDIVWFQDAPVQNPDGSWNDAICAKTPLPERPAGGELCARLKRGDVLIIAKMDRAFRKLSDCVLMMDRWERLGVALIVCDFPSLMDLDNPYQKAMAQLCAVFAELERKLISQRTREALALKKRKGHGHNRFPGYGFSWKRQFDREQGKYVKVRVPDPEERKIMDEIVKWKSGGHSWDEIHLNLQCQGVLTKHGTPWSRSRIVRAFGAELSLRAKEPDP